MNKPAGRRREQKEHREKEYNLGRNQAMEKEKM
jgi:hypothetical protein